jgi:hypothetical protein
MNHDEEKDIYYASAEDYKSSDRHEHKGYPEQYGGRSYARDFLGIISPLSGDLAVTHFQISTDNVHYRRDGLSGSFSFQYEQYRN